MLGGIDVYWDGNPFPFCQSHELMMREFDCVYTSLRRQIKTIAQFDYSADNRGMIEVPPRLGCPLIGANNIVFPEINSGSEPVMIVCAGLKQRTAQKFLGGFKIASVIGKN